MSTCTDAPPEVFPQTAEQREHIAQECERFAFALSHVAHAVSCVAALYRQQNVAIDTPLLLLHRTIATLTIILERQPQSWRVDT